MVARLYLHTVCVRVYAAAFQDNGYLSRDRMLLFQKMNKNKNLRRLLPKGSISKVLLIHII